MNRWVRLLPLLIVLFVLVAAATRLHPVGEPEHREMDDYFIMNAQQELGVNNVVTAVVFDYRGFDTLGEATVLFAAITSVFTVFWGRVK